MHCVLNGIFGNHLRKRSGACNLVFSKSDNVAGIFLFGGKLLFLYFSYL